ncbi:MAG: reverse transcriptase family protein [Bacteroidales bacterium]|nr:reverse transcriptase family protein [Bacteroidales bacterium]
MDDYQFYNFPATVTALEVKISKIAVENCGWACYDPTQNIFLKKCHNVKYRESLYHSFEIPKKNGGVRQITAPTGKLKEMQKALAIYLSKFYSAPWPVNGFTIGCSVYTNAIAHCGKNYVFNIDLKNFFPSITSDMIKRSLLKRGLQPEVAKYISSISTLEGALTQGSPTSPIVSNLVCFDMDMKLLALSQKYGLRYTRYADDITFSSQHNVYSPEEGFRIELQKIIEDFGFKLNEEKTRIQKRGMRQEVTGLTVGEKVNVSRKYLKNLRSMIFKMEMRGFNDQEFRQAHGKVAYLLMIRGKDDPCAIKLKNRLRSIKGYKMGIANAR